MLNNFQSLSIEATTLENSNHNLETEMEITKMTIQDLTRQVHELETQLGARDALVSEYEKQVIIKTNRGCHGGGNLVLFEFCSGHMCCSS